MNGGISVWQFGCAKLRFYGMCAAEMLPSLFMSCTLSEKLHKHTFPTGPPLSMKFRQLFGIHLLFAGPFSLLTVVEQHMGNWHNVHPYLDILTSKPPVQRPFLAAV